MKAAIITVSDRALRRECVELSGTAAAERLRRAGIEVVSEKIVPEEFEAVARALRECAGREAGIDLILTTGGIGLCRSDTTPEATCSVIDRQIPGIAEAIREAGRSANPAAMLSRGVAGIKNHALIVNLSDEAATINEALDVVLPVLEQALGMIRGELVEA